MSFHKYLGKVEGPDGDVESLLLELILEIIPICRYSRVYP